MENYPIHKKFTFAHLKKKFKNKNQTNLVLLLKKGSEHKVLSPISIYCYSIRTGLICLCKIFNMNWKNGTAFVCVWKKVFPWIFGYFVVSFIFTGAIVAIIRLSVGEKRNPFDRRFVVECFCNFLHFCWEINARYQTKQCQFLKHIHTYTRIPSPSPTQNTEIIK